MSRTGYSLTIFMTFFSNFSCHINDTDGNGMTALMWSCFRATQGLDPTRLLLTLGKAVLHLRGLFRLKRVVRGVI